VSPDYLDAIRRHFARPDAWAAVIAYAHRLNGPPAEYAGILCYELYLRYHALGLAYAGSPYAFHTIGSAMACSAEAYAAVSGMNRRLAAEDFYFLQQLAKTGPVEPINEATVYPSARASARVPFGTGARMREFQSSAEDAYLVYRPEVYGILKHWFVAVSTSPESSAESLLTSAEDIHPELRMFLDRSAFERNWENLQRNSADARGLIAQFHRWFDGLKTLRCIHHLRDHGLPQENLFCALDGLLTMAKLHTDNEIPPTVIPAKAGTQSVDLDARRKIWVPAFAGMTERSACIADIGREDFEAQRRLLDFLRRIPMNKAGIRV
jgi:hypothetical protein